MMIIPIKNNDQLSLLVCLEDDNIERVLNHDPVEILMEHLPAVYHNVTVKAIAVTYINEQDKEVLLRLLKENNIIAAIEHATRGFKYRPERGDNDNPYEKLV